MRYLYLKRRIFIQSSNCGFLCLLFFTSGFSAYGATEHPTFNQKDIFQSAVFLANNSLIPDYKDEKIWFYTQHDNIKAYFTESGVLYKMGPEPETELEKKPAEKDKDDDDGDNIRLKYALIKMNWLGANQHPVIERSQKAPGYHTYIDKDGNDYKSFKTEGYKIITYRDLYPGIDVEYDFTDKGGIKYGLIVKPGADLNVIKFAYNGAVKTLTKNSAGDVIISTDAGNLTEHAPSTYYANGQLVASEFSITDNIIQFSFQEGYDKNQSLTIDPWVSATVFTPDNIGFDVDYDTIGNVFAYGAGPSSISDKNDFFEVAKYNTAGILLWIFNGSVPSIPWNSWWSTGGNHGYNYAGNILVEKSTGKVYVGKGHDGNGTQAIRLNTAGAYDNFKSVINSNFQEDWGIGYNCVNSSLIALGGGVSSNINMALINTTTGATTNNNITTHPGSHQDIICGTFDDAGNLYVIMDDYTDSTDIPYWNTLYRVNSTLNGYTWVSNSGYTTFSEEYNATFWVPNGSSNWNNCLAANGSYLFYYDGLNLKAFNLATGVGVGNATTIAGNQATIEGGIAVDNCNNVYVGGIGVIKTFNFDGTNFNAVADIQLGGTFGMDKVEDVKYCSQNNTLYVTGVGVVGTYAATLSVSCNPLAISAPSCTSATVTIQGASEVTYTYRWTNSSGTVISETANSTTTSNTITGLSQGKYYVAVQWEANCNGSSIIDSVEVNCGAEVTVNDTTICGGQTALLTAVGSPSGGSYSWSPGAHTGASITVSPTSTSTYTVTYTSTSGSTATATSIVTIKMTGPTLTLTQTNPDCKQTGDITATANGGVSPYEYSINGGPYQTSNTFDSINTAGTYTIMVMDSQGCLNTVTANIPYPNTVASGIADSVLCYGGASGKIIASAIGGIPPFQFAIDTGAYQTNDTFPNLTVGRYMIFAEDSNGCADSTTIQVFQPDSLYFDSVNTTGIKCPGQKNGTITVIASGGTPLYSYSATQDTVNFFIENSNGVIQNLDTGNYFVILSDANGCTEFSSAYIRGPIADSFSYTVDSTLCYGDQYHDGAINITALVPQHAPYSYSLDNGPYQPSDTFASLAADTYQIVTIDVNGCLDTLPDIVVGLPPPSFAIAYPEDTSLQTGQSVQLNAYLTGANSSTSLVFAWLPWQGLSCVDCANPVATPYSQYSKYTITITYNNHCIVDTSVVVLVSGGEVWVPSAFSPNGDGNNDIFYIYGNEIRDIDMKVFNRWGEKVFESHSQFTGWDGTYKGVLQNPGVFVYEANVYFLDNTSKFLKGSVSLLR